MWYKHCQVFFAMYYQPLGSYPKVTRILKRVLDPNPLHQDTHENGKIARYFATLGQLYITHWIYRCGM